MSENIIFHVAEHKKFRALYDLSDLNADTPGRGQDGRDVAKTMHRISLARLLTEQFESEAHFWPGEVSGFEGQLPRFSKPSLSQLTKAGHDVRINAVVLDWDLKDFSPLKDAPRSADGKKLPWVNLTPEQTAMVWSTVGEALEGLATADVVVNVIYTSPAGLRFVVALAVDISAGNTFEAYHKRIRSLFALHGLECDESCKDWTRLYRVPKMRTESGMETWDQPWFVLIENWETLHVPNLDAVTIEPDVVHEAVHRRLDGEPDIEEAKKLVEYLDGTWKATEAQKRARVALKGRESYPYIWEARIPPDGGRHTAMTRVVGDTVGALFGLNGCGNLDFIYALLYPFAERLGNDEPWTSKLWEMATAFWAREESKARAKTAQTEAKVAKLVERKLTARERFVAGVRTWAGDVLEGLDDVQALDRIVSLKLPIVVDRRAKEFRILREDGFYDRTSYGLANLKRRIVECGMDWLIPTTAEVTKKDAVVSIDLDEDTILEKYARTYAHEVCKLHLRGNSLTINGDEAVFVHVPFRLRDDLTPTYDERVDSWLRSMVEADQFDRFQAAIGYLVAIYDGPTAAVSLVGVKSTGKKMLAHGLAECFVPWTTPVPGVELTTKHNDALIRNPIIWIDEGVDEGKSGANFADVFRRVVTGGAIQVEPKNLAKVEISGVHRILFTANNLDAVRSIGGKKARGEHDWEALSERVVHFRLRDDAASYLRSIGGLNGTKGWIEGDAGQPSGYIIAKHILWIYTSVLPRDENGQIIRQGARLLMEGAPRQAIIEDMEADAGLVPDVALAINQLLGQAMQRGKIAVVEGKILVQSSAVVEAVREKISTAKTGDIREALSALTDEPQLRSVGGVFGRWRPADPKRIFRIVERHGSVSLPLAQAAGFNIVDAALQASTTEEE